MSNSYYNHSTYPAPNSPGSSAQLRAELELVTAGFTKLPTLSGNGYKVAMVNAAGDALIASAALQNLTIDNSPIGATTANTGRFTTVTATSGLFGPLTGNVTGDITSTGSSSFANVTITGTLDMQTISAGTISGLNTPTNASDAANKDYVDTQVNTRLAKAGGTMSGAIAMGTNKITGLGDPSSAQDAATKNYIDTLFGSTTAAAASAAAAATSATNAANSATSASTSAGNASTSATNAATSYTNFNNQYLGSKASDPSTNNSGGALVAGNLYFNSTLNNMKVYDGSAWLLAYLPATGYLALSGGTMTGSLAMGSSSSVTRLNNALSLTGGTSANQYVAGGTIQSDVTASAVAYQSFIGTAAAAFTLNSLIHFRAGNGGVGSGSTVSTQYGFYYDSAASLGAQNFAFSGNLAASGTNNYNLYMNGSALNYLSGNTGIGTNNPGRKLHVVDSQNTSTGVRIDNTDAGSAAYWGLYLHNGSTNKGQLLQMGAGYTTANQYVQDSTVLDAAGVGGISLTAKDAAGAIRFYTGGTAVRATMDASGNLNGTDTALTRYMLKDQGYSYFNSNTTSALDYVNGSHQRWAPSGTVTLSVANWPPSGNLGELLIEGVNLGAATITWPTINWIKSDGTTTTTFSGNGVTLQSSGTDWVVLWTRDAGTTIYGKIIR